MRNLKKFMTILLAAGLACALFSTTALAWLAGDITYDANGFYTTSFGIVYYQPPMKNLDGAYAISNVGQLFWFAALVNGDTEQTDVAEAVPDADAVLTVDIAIPEGYEWTPIGYNYDSESETGGYTGSFDGQGYAVSGVCINADAADGGYYGLFGYVAGGTVENVILKDCSISVSAADGVAVRVGGIAGAVSGTVSNCESSGTVGAGTTGEYSRVGGIVGSVYSSGTVSNCESSTVVSGAATDSRAYVGGIAGDGSGTVSSCASSGAVSAEATGGRSYAGGIVGNANSNSTVSNCENSGRVSATATDEQSYAGGIAGYASSSTVSNCENSGTVSATATDGQSYAGGIAGYANSNSTVSNCENSGAVSTTTTNNNSYAGGIAAHVNSSTVSSCENSGTVSASVSAIYDPSGRCYVAVGGIAGHTTDTSTISKCINSGAITGDSTASNYSANFSGGGITGALCNGSVVIDCKSSGNVSGTAASTMESSSLVGGIVGRTVSEDPVAVSGSYSTGTISADSTMAGGVVGWNYACGTIANCCYLEGTAAYGAVYNDLYDIDNDGVYGDTVYSDLGASSLTAAEFANGTALSLLNDGSQVWHQTIGVDAYPCLNITTGTTGSVGTDFDDSDEQDEEKEKPDEQEEPDDTGDADDTGDTGDTEDTGDTDTGGDSSGGTDATTPGDLNGDGEVDASDLTILARHVGKVEYITDETYLANADVTGDGNVDASDLTKLAQYVGKIISSLD